MRASLNGSALGQRSPAGTNPAMSVSKCKWQYSEMLSTLGFRGSLAKDQMSHLCFSIGAQSLGRTPDQRNWLKQTIGHSVFRNVGVTVALQVSIEIYTGEALPGEKVQFLHVPILDIKT